MILENVSNLLAPKMRELWRYVTEAKFTNLSTCGPGVLSPWLLRLVAPLEGAERWISCAGLVD